MWFVEWDSPDVDSGDAFSAPYQFRQDAQDRVEALAAEGIHAVIIGGA